MKALGRNAGPGVADRAIQNDAVVFQGEKARLDIDKAIAGKLDGVVSQPRQNLPQTCGVTDDNGVVRPVAKELEVEG